MSASKRESWGSLRKLPSGRWQARYPGPDGETYTARTEGDKALTFLTKTDARTWLAAVHTKISLGQWKPPAAVAAQNRTEAAAESLADRLAAGIRGSVFAESRYSEIFG